MNFFKRLFQKKDPDFYNVHHPLYMEKVEEAFKAGGVQYYRMKEEVDMPYGRYKEVSACLYEVNLRMDLKTMIAYLDELSSNINGIKGQINLEKAFQVIGKMRSRAALQFEPETAKKLALVIYFDESEDITSFDVDHSKKKLAIWEAEGSYDFFLTRPIGELLGLSDISRDSLIDYIKASTEILKELSLEQPSPV